MRKWLCVPMMTVLLLLSGCGRTTGTEDLRLRYQEMSGCEMTAAVRCSQEGAEWEALLKCTYMPEGESTVEVLEPEMIAGIKAVVSNTEWRLEYQDTVLNVGELSGERISPAACLPHMMSALRNGWLLEENDESWREVPCRRLALDQTGEQGGKIVSVLWLRLDDGMPLRGEISVGGEIILTAEFTEFEFHDIMTH